MVRGRKPKPAGLRLVEAGERAAGLGVDPGHSNTATPAILRGDPRAASAWRILSAELERLNLLMPLDRNTLAMYCMEWSTYCEATEHIRAEGSIGQGYKGQGVVSPWHKIRAVAANNMAKILSEFGFSPAARERVKAAALPDAPTTGDSIDEFIL